MTDKLNDGRKKIEQCLDGVHCFTAGTQIVVGMGLADDGTMLYNTKNIEEILVGDLVLSCDPFTSEWSYQTVMQTFENTYTGEVILLEIEDEVIEVTGGHPFWVVDGVNLASRPIVDHILYGERGMTPNGRWVNARDLKPGDIFLDYFDNEFTLENISYRYDTVTVYNFEVVGTHSYVVSSLGVLVHNNSKKGLGTAADVRKENRAKGIPDKQIGPSGTPKIIIKKLPTRKAAQDAAKAAAGKGGTVMEHSNPAVGNPHFHGVKPDGVKIRTHFEYPK